MRQGESSSPAYKYGLYKVKNIIYYKQTINLIDVNLIFFATETWTSAGNIQCLLQEWTCSAAVRPRPADTNVVKLHVK